jgi:hypothetical protein
LFQFSNESDHFWGRDSWFAAADGSGKNGSGFVVSGQDFRDASVADSKLSRNVARTNPELRKLDDSDSDVIRQRSAVDENATQLKSDFTKTNFIECFII